jgi:hypothetical protein
LDRDLETYCKHQAGDSMRALASAEGSPVNAARRLKRPSAPLQEAMPPEPRVPPRPRAKDPAVRARDEAIRRWRREGMSCKALADFFNLSLARIRQIIYGRKGRQEI